MARNRYFEDEVLVGKLKANVIRRALRYAAPYKRSMLTMVVIMLGMGFVALLPPLLNMVIINRVLPAETGAPAPSDWSKYAALAVSGIILVSIADQIYSFFRNRIMAKTGYKIVRDMRRDVFSHLQRLSFDYFDSRPAGKILVRVTSYIDELSNMFSTAIVGFLVDSTKMLLILIWLFVLYWKFALIVMAAIVPMGIALVLIHAGMHKRVRVVRNKVSNRTAYIAENINGIAVTKAFNRAALNCEIYDDLALEANRSFRKFIRLNEIFMPTMEFFWYLGTVLVYFAAVAMATKGGSGLSVGLVTSFILYLGMFNQPLNNVAQIFQQLANATGNMERIFETLDTPPMLTDKPDAYQMPPIEGNVRYDDVTFSYDGKVNVLQGFSLDVPKGKTIALVGPTGGGKSTVVSLLPRFYDIAAGAITIDGHNIADVKTASLRSQIGIMLQDSFILTGTVMENIRYGDLDATDEQCREAAQKVFADEIIAKLPNQYDTQISEYGTTLSAGERQLISFARTILSDPKILVLDEATSSIDTETEQKIQRALATVLEGRTSFIIAHRLSTIKQADCILYISNKGIAEAGTFDQLMQTRGLFYELVTSSA